MSKAVRVSVLPKCQARSGCHAKARYDFKSWSGPWMYACEVHWTQTRASDTLGTGKGQYLYLQGEKVPPHAT